jgi:hypothetical protein
VEGIENRRLRKPHRQRALHLRVLWAERNEIGMRDVLGESQDSIIPVWLPMTCPPKTGQILGDPQGSRNLALGEVRVSGAGHLFKIHIQYIKDLLSHGEHQIK